MSVRITETWFEGTPKFESEVSETNQVHFEFDGNRHASPSMDYPTKITKPLKGSQLTEESTIVAGHNGSLTLEWIDDPSPEPVFPVKFLQTPNPETLIDIADAVFTTRNRLPPSYFDKYPWRDSREVVELIKTWAEEFERLHSETNWNEDEDADYIISVDRFAEAKIKELLS